MCPLYPPGVRALSAVAAMNFFKQTPFYDNTCNNEDPRIPADDLGRDIMQSMTGMEYDIDDNMSSPPDLWIINQQLRRSATRLEKIRVYYIMNDMILQAPNASHLMEARLSNINHHLSSAFTSLATFKPSVGGSDVALSPASATSSASRSIGSEEEASILLDTRIVEELRAKGLGQGVGWGADTMREIAMEADRLAKEEAAKALERLHQSSLSAESCDGVPSLGTAGKGATGNQRATVATNEKAL